MELRDGRCVAEHGTDLDIQNLSEGRELIVDELGTVTLPPDILTQMGGPGSYSVGELESGKLSLVGERISSVGELVLSPSCPACNHDYKDTDDQLCPSCGSSRPMVEA